MAEDNAMPDAAPPDPHPGQAPADVQPEPMPQSPWGPDKPLPIVKDPAVRMEAPPDPGAEFLGRFSRPGQAMGPNELLMAGIGQILDQQARMMEMLREGAKF